MGKSPIWKKRSYRSSCLKNLTPYPSERTDDTQVTKIGVSWVAQRIFRSSQGVLRQQQEAAKWKMMMIKIPLQARFLRVPKHFGPFRFPKFPLCLGNEIHNHFAFCYFENMLKMKQPIKISADVVDGSSGPKSFRAFRAEKGPSALQRHSFRYCIRKVHHCSTTTPKSLPRRACSQAIITAMIRIFNTLLFASQMFVFLLLFYFIRGC